MTQIRPFAKTSTSTCSIRRFTTNRHVNAKATMSSSTGKFQKFSDDFSFDAQPTPEDVLNWSDKGFKSIVSVRQPNEPGVLANEEELANDHGLAFRNVPVKVNCLVSVCKH